MAGSAEGSKKLSQNSGLGEFRGGEALSGRGMGVSPKFLLLPRSLSKGAGETGGEGFEIITKAFYLRTLAYQGKLCQRLTAPQLLAFFP